MSVKIPGTTLVVDNDFDDVRLLIQSFWADAQRVVFMTTPPEANEVPPNVRLAVIDLVMGVDGDPSQEDYLIAARTVRNIATRSPLRLVAIFSIHAEESDAEMNDEILQRLKRAYSEVAEDDIEEIEIRVFDKSMGAADLRESIQAWIKAKPALGLVLKWEECFENGLDAALRNIVDESGIQSVVKATWKEFREEGTPRELWSIFARVHERYGAACLQTVGQEIRDLSKEVFESVHDEENLLAWYARFHYLQAYFRPEENEPLWTGDLFETGLDDEQMKYAVVVTPACDLAQRRTARNIKVVFGRAFSLVPEYKVDADPADVPGVVKMLGLKDTGNFKNRAVVVETLIGGGDKTLPQNLYVLKFVRPIDGHDYFHVVLDLTRVGWMEPLEHALPEGWRRVCRLDSPYVEDLIQSYSTFVGRVGTPSLPKNVLQQEQERTKS